MKLHATTEVKEAYVCVPDADRAAAALYRDALADGSPVTPKLLTGTRSRAEAHETPELAFAAVPDWPVSVYRVDATVREGDGSYGYFRSATVTGTSPSSAVLSEHGAAVTRLLTSVYSMPEWDAEALLRRDAGFERAAELLGYLEWPEGGDELVDAVRLHAPARAAVYRGSDRVLAQRLQAAATALYTVLERCAALSQPVLPYRRALPLVSDLATCLLLPGGDFGEHTAAVYDFWGVSVGWFA